MSTRGLRIGWNVLVVAAMVVYIARFPRYPLASTLFPRLVGYPVLGLALVSLVLEGLRGRHPVPAAASHAGREWISVRDVLWAVAFGAGYLALWEPLGFVLDTVVLMVAAPLILGYPRRRWLWLVGIGIATAALFTFLFHLGAGAILPQGFLNVGWF